VLPRFNTKRMLDDYVARLYRPAAELGERIVARDSAPARDLAQWKRRIRAIWPNVKVRRLGEAPARVAFGEGVTIAVDAMLNGLNADEVTVEMVLEADGHAGGTDAIPFVAAGSDGDTTRFELRLVPEHCGRLQWRIRAYPRHPQLAHRFELGLMLWV
jgi:starch phosphorylase